VEGPDLDPATAARLAAARADPKAAARRLRLGALEPGAIGLLEAEVRAVGSVRRYNRKRGGEGLLQRVTLADATGEVDLVLWDDETRLAQPDGPLQPGAHVRLHGPLVRAGRSPGSLELGVTGAEVVALPASAPRILEGRLTAIGPTRPVGDPPAMRFTCELTVETARGIVRVAAWDAAVRAALAAGLGSRVVVHGSPNPFLEGWWTATEVSREPPSLPGTTPEPQRNP
jgi:hypothetical protein